MVVLRCFAFFFLISLISCQLETQETLPTPMPTKVFLPRVNPEHGEKISYEEYKAKLETSERLVGPICVYYVAFHVLEDGDDGLRVEDYLSRSVLIINGEVWTGSKTPDIYRDYLGLLSTSENSEQGNAIGPYDFCWDVDLAPGMHTVEFITRKTSGEELSYRWSFIITE